MTDDEAEQVIRDYFSFLETGEIKSEALDQLRAELEAEADPVRRVILHGRLIKEGDPSELEARFVSGARQFASANHIPLDAFNEMGVPPDVMQRVYGSGPARSRPAPQAHRPRGRRSFETWWLRARPKIEDGEPFQLRDLAERMGETTAAVQSMLTGARSRVSSTPGRWAPGAWST